jgi:hypothetical protein
MRRFTWLAVFLVAPVLAFAQVYPTQPGIGGAQTAWGWEPDLYNGLGGYGSVTLDSHHNLNVNIAGPTSPEGGVSVVINPYQEAWTDRSGAIAVGATWQQIAVANPDRRRFVVQNPCSTVSEGIAASESLFLNSGPTAPTSTAGSFELLPCGEYETGTDVVGTGAVWLYSATAGHLFTAKEW